MEVKEKTYALILNYNSSRDSIELFHSLQSLRFSNLFILVLDNGSEPEELKKLKQNIPLDKLVLNNKNLGYAGGNNIGIGTAIDNDAEFVWLLNPDIRVERNTLPALLELIKSNPRIAAVGPRIISRLDKNEIFSDGGVVFYDERCHADLINYDQSLRENPPSVNFSIDYIDGSCILLNAEALKELGFLPKEYFLYFEETDWCTKAKKKGWELGINSFVNAYNLKSSRNSTFIYYYFRNRLIFARKYHPAYWKVYWYYSKLILNKLWSRFRYGRKDPLLKWEVKGLVDAYKFLI